MLNVDLLLDDYIITLCNSVTFYAGYTAATERHHFCTFAHLPHIPDTFTVCGLMHYVIIAMQWTAEYGKYYSGC